MISIQIIRFSVSKILSRQSWEQQICRQGSEMTCLVVGLVLQWTQMDHSGGKVVDVLVTSISSVILLETPAHNNCNDSPNSKFNLQLQGNQNVKYRNTKIQKS